MIVAFTHNVAGRGAAYRAEQLLARLPGDDRVVLYAGSPEATERHQRNGRAEMILSPSRLSGPLRAGWSPAEARWRVRHGTELVEASTEPLERVIAFDARPTVLWPARALAKRFGVPLHADIGDYFWYGGAARLRRPLWASRAFEPLEHLNTNSLVRAADSVTTVTPRLSEEVEKRRPDLACTLVMNGADIAGTPPVFPRRPGGTVRLVAGGSTGYDIEYVGAVADATLRTGADVEVWMTGKESEGFAHAKVKRLGFLDDAAYDRVLLDADFALAPSSPSLANEGRCPGRIPAFWGKGLAVLMTDVGPWTDDVRRHDLGLLLPSDVAGFAAGVVEAAKEPPSPEERTRIYREARRYTWDRLATDFAAAIRIGSIR